MRKLRDMSIRWKLIWIIMLTSVAALLVSSAAHIIYEVVTFEDRIVRDVGGLADVIGANTAAAIEFDRQRDAEQILATLRVRPSIRCAAIYKNGKLFAAYHASEKSADAPPTPEPVSYRFAGDHLHLYRPILLEREQIGTIFLCSDFEELYGRLRKDAIISGIYLAIPLLLAGVLSMILQRIISRPILDLAQTAQQVSRNKDYSIRASAGSKDEVGQLVDGFNDMLAQMGAHEKALTDAHALLEERVKSRTAELARANDVLRREILDRRLAEDALRESEAKLSAAQRIARLGSWSWEPGSGKMVWNQFMYEIFDVDPEVKPDYELFQSRVHPDDRVRVARVVNEAVLSGAPSYTLDHRILDRQGHVRYVFRIARIARDSSGKALHVNGVTQDITERKQAEEFLRESEARLEAAQRIARLANWTWDLKTGIVTGSSQLWNIFDVPSGTPMHARTFLRLTHPEDRPKARVIQQALHSGAGSYEMDFRIVDRAGRVRYLNTIGRISRDGEGNPWQVTGVSQDITDRKEAEAALRESEALLAEAKSIARLGRWTWDLRTGRSHWDGLSYEIFDADPSTATTIEWFTSRIHPDDRTRVSQTIERALKSDATGYTVDFRILDHAENVRYVSGTARITRDSTGEAILITGVAQDITKRKRAEEALRESEQRYRSIGELLPFGFWMCAPDGGTIYLSDSFLKMAGTTLDQCKALGWTHLLPPEDIQRTLADWERCRNLGAMWDYEHRIHGADGVFHDILSRGVPVRNERGEITTWVGINLDITDRKRTENALREAHRQLVETAHRAGMSEIATSVLHNVGNVLTGINASATIISDALRQSRLSMLSRIVEMLKQNVQNLPQFLANDPKGSQLIPYMDALSKHLLDENRNMLQELESLNRNISHIRNIVGMQQSYAGVAGVRERMALSGLIEDAIRINSAAISRHQIDIVRDFAPLPPMDVEKHKVLQILVNLLSNARYAVVENAQGNRRITIQLRSPGEGRVQIVISDNGLGIAPDDLPRIFRYGFTTRKEGHGFGLHSSALAAQSLGGVLVAQSEGPGKGASFTLELPAQAAPQP
ncbi:MAG TPA: PAS domain-containing protein [Planctomycetota bacterium]|jgi:PAS domain S-box-containing protein